VGGGGETRIDRASLELALADEKLRHLELRKSIAALERFLLKG